MFERRKGKWISSLAQIAFQQRDKLISVPLARSGSADRKELPMKMRDAWSLHAVSCLSTREASGLDPSTSGL